MRGLMISRQRFSGGQKPMRFRNSLIILMVSVMLLSSGCAPSGEVLPLSETHFSHPSGVFSIPVPRGWEVTAGETEQVVTLVPDTSGPDIRVIMIAGQTEEAMSETAQGLLQRYMGDYLPYDDYEIYNQAELRVDRYPAVILDIARPQDGSYHVGRMILVYLPGHLVYILGFGDRSAWDSFLPTFRKMMAEMSFTLETFPLEE